MVAVLQKFGVRYSVVVAGVEKEGDSTLQSTEGLRIGFFTPRNFYNIGNNHEMINFVSHTYIEKKGEVLDRHGDRKKGCCT